MSRIQVIQDIEPTNARRTLTYFVDGKPQHEFEILPGEIWAIAKNIPCEQCEGLRAELAAHEEAIETIESAASDIKDAKRRFRR